MIYRLQEVRHVYGAEPVAELLQELLNREDEIDRDKEHFYCVHLDTRLRVKLVEVVSIGTLNASLVHPREVFRRAVYEGTYSIVIGHNHPSGNVDPSDEDIKVSRKLVEAGNILNIEVLDHIIFSKNGHSSLKGEALF